MAAFDPNAAADPNAGIFGLPHDDQARVHLLPVPFDATTSYGGGAATGPEAILEASMQVDLYDHQFGRVYERGISMVPIDETIRSQSIEARAAAVPIIEKGGADEGDAAIVAGIDAAGDAVNEYVRAWTTRTLEAGRIAGVVGGDHSTPYGAIAAAAAWTAERKEPLGILQIDAHMDLRHAFEGFRWSHASIMWNVLDQISNVERLVQVGIRDYCEEELDVARAAGDRVVTHFDFDWWRTRDSGASFASMCRAAIDRLPSHVYVSFDIDGLSPELCPGTGTPVPGGLSFNDASLLLEELARSGRTIVAFDVNEVCPQPHDGGFNANVGARILYKLCGAATFTS